jgi:hypothetical protein
MGKEVYTNKEIFNADIELSHFGPEPLNPVVIQSSILDSSGLELLSVRSTLNKVIMDNCIPVTSVSLDLSCVTVAQKLMLEVIVENTPFRNRWDFWVYPVKQAVDAGNVIITENLDIDAEAVLRKGGSVLLLNFGKVGKKNGAEVAIGFSSIFWNTAWTNNQAPHTLGILVDPRNPVFNEFPTEYHSNWQWWDPVSHSQAMIINDFPADLKPLIQPIDTWFENRRLALVFEAKVSGGKLLVCSIDLKQLSEDRVVSKQLKNSILSYMNSDQFEPDTEVDLNEIRQLSY